MLSRKLLIILVFILSGCNGSGAVNAAAPVAGDNAGPATAGSESAGATAVSDDATELTLRLDELIAYRDLKIRWLEIEDSRCPIGVTCVWAGQMEATLEVAQGANSPVEVKLLTKAGREPEVTEVAGYALSLLDITPHPKQNVTPQRNAHTLRLGIIKL